MKIMITGSSGFIGSHLKERWKAVGHQIVELDRKEGKELKDISIDSNTDVVVHLAAWADVRASIERPNEYWDNNVTTTTNVQKICHKKEIQLLYASSSCIHAWHKSPYGISKKVNEETAYPGQTGLRFTTVYGEGARDTMMIGRLVRNEAKYATTHIRDFIHVEDVMNVIDLLLKKSVHILKPAYDVGTGKGNRVDYLANDICGRNLPVNKGDDCEAKDNTANIRPLQDLGWNPTINVVDYLKEKVGV
jgi:nucleoside-diphosphate-sugar epimerase